MAFAGVKIITLSEGEITHLHVDLKGAMNALFGPRRQGAGKAGGGLCYDYDVVKRNDGTGEPSAASAGSTCEKPRWCTVSSANSPSGAHARRKARRGLRHPTR